MPVKSRTIDKVRYILFLLGEGFSYGFAPSGDYVFKFNERSYKLTRSALWKNTPNECVGIIKENIFGLSQERYFEKNSIDHLHGEAYLIAHRQRNEDYLRYLEVMS